MRKSNKNEGSATIIGLLFVAVLLVFVWCKLYESEFVSITKLQGNIIDKEIMTLEVEYVGNESYIGTCGGMRGSHECTKYRPILSTRLEEHYVFIIDSTDEKNIVNEKEFNSYEIGDYIEVEKSVDDNNRFKIPYIDYDIK